MSSLSAASMMALIITRRTREIGVRVALGATAKRVVWTILRLALRVQPSEAMRVD